MDRIRHPEIADKILDLLSTTGGSWTVNDLQKKFGDDISAIAATIQGLMKSEIGSSLIKFTVKGDGGGTIVAANEKEVDIHMWLLSTGGFTGEYQMKERKQRQEEEEKEEYKRIAREGLEVAKEANIISKKSADSARNANVIAVIALIVSAVAVVLSIFLQ